MQEKAKTHKPIDPQLAQRAKDHAISRKNDGDQDFPYKLFSVKSRPHTVFYLGDISLLHRPIIGIVGPRKHSEYANTVLQHLFPLAARYDLVTISGLAPGVDQLCHRLSLVHNIPTIAVLGGGLKRYLQTPDRTLIQDIVSAGGLVVSEFPLDYKPEYYTFPQRNRIIAGLSDIVLLPEASTKSGSLITAEYAISMHKPVYGVPNSIFSLTSAGVLQLLSEKKILPAIDLSACLSKHFSLKSQTSPISPLLSPSCVLSPQEQSLMDMFSPTQTFSLNDLLREDVFSSQELLSLLTLLEMKQCIYQPSPGMYKIV